MDENSVIENARYIFSTGKLIHDRIMRVKAEALSCCGDDDMFSELSIPQLHMIMMIRMRGDVSITELSGILGVSPPSASTMVDRLVERAFLTREPSKKDRRKVVVQVAPEVVTRIEKVEERILSSFVDLVEKIGPETTRKWCEVLEQVKYIVGKELDENIGES